MRSHTYTCACVRPCGNSVQRGQSAVVAALLDQPSGVLAFVHTFVCVWLVRSIPSFLFFFCGIICFASFIDSLLLVSHCVLASPFPPCYFTRLARASRTYQARIQSTLLQCPNPQARRRRALFSFFHSRHASLQQIRGIFIFFAVGAGGCLSRLGYSEDNTRIDWGGGVTDEYIIAVQSPQKALSSDDSKHLH